MMRRTPALFRTGALLSVAVLMAACSPPAEQPSSSSASSPPATPSSSAAPGGPIRGPEPSVVTPLIAHALAEPIPVPATDGKVHLAYELLVTNILPHELTLTSVTVLDRDVSLLDLTGDQLSHWTRV